MKLKKLLTLGFIQEFQQVLTTDFENELFIASLRNYASHGNPLRFHNFAFSMRELVLTIIERKAPNNDVIKSVWYEREHEIHEVTRRQKLKYCGQGQLTDKYIDSDVLDELNESIKDYLKAFNFFNKYTHITEKHFHANPKKFFEEVDFLSIGGNDLKQFFFAADRENERVRRRYDTLNVSFLTFLEGIVNRCVDTKTPLSFCGEDAGKPIEALCFAAMGLRELSMRPASIGPVKNILLKTDLNEARLIINEARKSGAQSVREHLVEWLRNKN